MLNGLIQRFDITGSCAPRPSPSSVKRSVAICCKRVQQAPQIVCRYGEQEKSMREISPAVGMSLEDYLNPYGPRGKASEDLSLFVA